MIKETWQDEAMKGKDVPNWDLVPMEGQGETLEGITTEETQTFTETQIAVNPETEATTVAREAEEIESTRAEIDAFFNPDQDSSGEKISVKEVNNADIPNPPTSYEEVFNSDSERITEIRAKESNTPEEQNEILTDRISKLKQLQKHMSENRQNYTDSEIHIVEETLGDFQKQDGDNLEQANINSLQKQLKTAREKLDAVNAENDKAIENPDRFHFMETKDHKQEIAKLTDQISELNQIAIKHPDESSSSREEEKNIDLPNPQTSLAVEESRKSSKVSNLTPENIENSFQNQNPIKVKIQRSSGEIEEGWVVTGTDGKEAVVIKYDENGEFMRKVVPLSELQELNKDNSTERKEEVVPPVIELGRSAGNAGDNGGGEQGEVLGGSGSGGGGGFEDNDSGGAGSPPGNDESGLTSLESSDLIKGCNSFEELTLALDEIGDITSVSDGYVHKIEDIKLVITQLRSMKLWPGRPTLENLTGTYGLRDKVAELFKKSEEDSAKKYNEYIRLGKSDPAQQDTKPKRKGLFDRG